MDAIAECEGLVEGISEKLEEKRHRLGEIEAEVADLEEQGVYGSVPSESWEGRNGGEKRYLRLVFGTEGGERRKEYVGADPAKIEAAKEKVKRTRLVLDLHSEGRLLEARVVRSRAALRTVLQRLGGGSLW